MIQNSSYKRILLKLSGENLMGEQSFGIDQKACNQTAQFIKNIREEGFELSIVIGGGNIFRGINLNDNGMTRTPADQMGMLATLMNGIALKEALDKIQCPAKVFSALECPKVAKNYNWREAQEGIANCNVLIFVGGTGNPYFTTDTAAAMRASEIQADILLKATKVNGIYDKDPKKYPDAKKYQQLTYTQFLAEKLQVMDSTAVVLCMNNKIPVFVFNMQMLGKFSLTHILTNCEHGTLVKDLKN